MNGDAMIRVLIADDHAQMRANIRRLLERTRDIQVVGEVADGGATIEALDSISFDVLLLDVEMPVMDGIDVLRFMKANNKQVNVLVLSGYADKQLVIGALELGANGYIAKDDASRVLINAIRAVYYHEDAILSKIAKQSLRS